MHILRHYADVSLRIVTVAEPVEPEAAAKPAAVKPIKEALGKSGLLTPWLAAWSPNMIVLGASSFLLLTVKT